MDRKLIESEIKLADDECCVVFDFGCYFPYSNAEVLKFDFSLGMKEFEDFRINHRYPNKNYQTISKTYGRKVSRLGYPYIMKLNEQGIMLLRLRVGTKESYGNLIFSLMTNMTKEKPICYLCLHYNFDENNFHFSTNEKLVNGDWCPHNWYSHAVNCITDKDVLLDTPRRADDTLIYEDIITPYPCALSDLPVY